MKKSGQITIFIIVAIILIIVIIFFFILRYQENRDLDNNQRVIYDYVYNCVGLVSEQGIFYIGIQGGYNQVPNPKSNYSLVEIPLYWKNGNTYLPKKNRIESEINDYIKDSLPYCINGFESFKNQDYIFDISDISVESSIEKNKIDVAVNFPFSVRKGKNVWKFEKFSAVLDSRLDKAINFSSMIISEQKKYPNSLPIGFIMNLANKNNFDFEIISLEDNEILIELVFDKDSGKPFAYAFINKYNWEEII
ncbi:MAG: hypothetical protein AABX54_03395 [Nanoarchaeota archaeon]